MTEPRDTQAEAAADPEVRPKVIEDLDVPGDGAKHIACRLRPSPRQPGPY